MSSAVFLIQNHYLENETAQWCQKFGCLLGVSKPCHCSHHDYLQGKKLEPFSPWDVSQQVQDAPDTPYPPCRKVPECLAGVLCSWEKQVRAMCYHSSISDGNIFRVPSQVFNFSSFIHSEMSEGTVIVSWIALNKKRIKKLYRCFQNRRVKNEGNRAQISPVCLCLLCVCGCHCEVLSLGWAGNNACSAQWISNNSVYENGCVSGAGAAGDREGVGRAGLRSLNKPQQRWGDVHRYERGWWEAGKGCANGQARDSRADQETERGGQEGGELV